MPASLMVAIMFQSNDPRLVDCDEHLDPSLDHTGRSDSSHLSRERHMHMRLMLINILDKHFSWLVFFQLNIWH